MKKLEFCFLLQKPVLAGIHTNLQKVKQAYKRNRSFKLNLLFSFFIISLFNASVSMADGNNNIYPSVVLQNDCLKITVLLPDSSKGYYRSTRFDWSGMIAQVEYDGHTFFQEWKDYNGNEPGPHNPLKTGTATGTAEEFRNPLGYEEAEVGDLFLKIGVGILKKALNEAYHWAYPFEFIEKGKWETLCFDDSIVFRQEITTDFGYAYQYEKVIVLDKCSPKVAIIHRLKNTGTKEIRSNAYCHNFFRFDEHFINSNYELVFSVNVKPLEIFDERFIIRDNVIRYEYDKCNPDWSGGHIEPQGIRSYILSNRKTNTAVQVKSDADYGPCYIGAWKWAFCPEPMILLAIKPDESFSWTSSYRFIKTVVSLDKD